MKSRKTTTKEETNTSRQIDEDLERRAEENYIRALMAAAIPPQPYRGPVVADFTDGQYAAMNSTLQGAETMGITAPSEVSRPRTRTVAGIRGVSMMPAYRDAMSRVPKKVRNQHDDFYEQLIRSLRA